MGYWDKREAAEETEPSVEDEQGVTLAELEASCLEECGEVEKSFRERMKAENKRFMDMCDSGYWFCVCFTSYEQRAEFLTSLGLDPDQLYYDGKEMAKACKRPVKTPDLKFAKTGKGGAEYSRMAFDLPKTHDD